MTYRDLGDGKQCSPAVDLNHQRVHLAHKHFLSLRALAPGGPIFALWEPVFFRGSIAYFIRLCGLIEPDGVLFGPQEDGVLGVGTGGAAQPAGHDPPVKMKDI